MPAAGYLWTPGYWAWNNSDYYWTPGTWVEPPHPGLLWTPGYWGWSDGAYAFHNGYWGTMSVSTAASTTATAMAPKAIAAAAGTMACFSIIRP